MSNFARDNNNPILPHDRAKMLNQKVKSNNNLDKIRNLVESTIDRRLNKFETSNLTKFVYGINPGIYLNFTKLSAVNADIAKNFIDSTNKTPSQIADERTGTLEDELVRAVITGTGHDSGFYADTSKGGIDGFKPQVKDTTVGQISTMTPYEYSYLMRQGYTEDETGVILDSRYRDLSTNSSGEIYSWSYSTTDATDRSGIFTTEYEITNITHMTLHKFYIPYTSSADNIYRRVSIFLDGLPNAIVGKEGRKYHFMCSTDTTDPNFIELTPIKDTIKFIQPLKTLHKIDVSFGSPLQRFGFGTDKFMATASDLNPTEFTATAHGLQSNNLIFARGYTTTDPHTDIATIAAVNSDTGHAVTYIDDNTFSIQVDTSGVTASGTTTIFNGNKRFMIPLTFKHLKGPESKDI